MSFLSKERCCGCFNVRTSEIYNIQDLEIENKPVLSLLKSLFDFEINDASMNVPCKFCELCQKNLKQTLELTTRANATNDQIKSMDYGEVIYTINQKGQPREKITELHCRVCLKKTEDGDELEDLNIFDELSLDVIEDVLKIKIDPEVLSYKNVPRVLCNFCKEDLEDAFIFKKQISLVKSKVMRMSQIKEEIVEES